MLLSILTAVDPSGINLPALASAARHITGRDGVEWLLATPEELIPQVADILHLELLNQPVTPLDPATPPAVVDLAVTTGAIRIIPTGSSALEPAQVGLALGEARGRWCWILGDADEPLPSAVDHLCDVLSEHAPRFVIGNALISSRYGIETAQTHQLPPGTLTASTLRQCWGHPAAAIPFAMRAAVLETAALRAGGGCRAVDLAEVLAPLLLADAAGDGWATEALLLHYRQHPGRTALRVSMLHLENTVRTEAWKAPEREVQLTTRHDFVPSWHIRMVDPAPAAWWPRCSLESTSKEPVSDAAASLPVVSVITATYPSPHRENFITELAESIFTQVGFDTRLIEWVIQEDGTSTSCRDRLTPELLSDPRVRIEYNHTRLGAAATRNIALSRVRGRVVLVADDDDVLLPDACATLLEGFSHNGVGWVGAGIESWDGRSFVPKNLAGIVERHGTTLAWGHPTNVFPVVHQACAFRVELLRAIGGWAALPQAEDMSLLVAASARARGFVSPVPVYRYRSHTDQMTAAGGFSHTEAASRVAVWRRACDLARQDASDPLAKAVLAADLTPASRTSRFFTN